MVVKDASGEAFPGNITAVPRFFIGLYGQKTIGRNRLALTDDDMFEHGPFDK